MSIEVLPLGAGRDVGRSCIIVRMAGRTLMFDCGMHMGYDDHRRFPDFTQVASGVSDYTAHIDCALITHFHLDHCGALPYFSEMCGYSGPILMSAPTRSIAPLMLEDFRKICVDMKGEQNFFTSDMIKTCLSKVTVMDLHQTIIVKDDIKVTTYYAGHVLGAVMFHVECKGFSVVYTGDYNMTGDRHLRAAWIERLKPNVVITESTYATKFRELKMKREKQFLTKVVETVEKGGKVLIPVFALGRAQELCILLDTYWESAKLSVPINFAGGLTERANHFYKTFTNWCNENVQRIFLKRNMFDFQHISPFDRIQTRSEEPMVLFATPGMLHGGLSLSVFKEWCDDAKNLVILPGYCVAGTIGHALLRRSDRVMIEGKEYRVKCDVRAMSFSAHTDQRGIMQLLEWLQPANVVLVHGEEERMRGLMGEVSRVMDIPCFMPANHERLVIPCPVSIPTEMPYSLLEQNRAELHHQFADELFNPVPSPFFTAHMSDCALESCQSLSLSCDLDLSPVQVRSLLQSLPVQITELAGNKTCLTWSEDQDPAVVQVLAAVPEPPALP